MDFKEKGLTTATGSKLKRGTFTAVLRHKPEDCPSKSGDCTYFFRVYNPPKEHRLIHFRAKTEVYDPQDVDLQKTYANVVNYGQFINYEINEVSNQDI